MNPYLHEYRRLGVNIAWSIVVLAVVVFGGSKWTHWNRSMRIETCYRTAVYNLLNGEDYRGCVEESGFLCRAFTNRTSRWLVVYEKEPDRRKKRRIIFGTNYENYSYQEVDDKAWHFLDQVLNGCVPEVESQAPETSLGIQPDSAEEKRADEADDVISAEVELGSE